MKWSILISVTSFLFMGYGSAVSQGIDFFEGSWEEALQLAEEENKLIFIDCYAEWCGPCKRMAANVFPDEKVGEFYNANFINLKWDMEKGKGLDFRKKYPVSAFPTLYFIDSKGEVVRSVTGARDVNGFIELGNHILKIYNPHIGFSDKYLEGDRSTETVYYHFKNLDRDGESILGLANEHLTGNSDLSDEYNLKILILAMTESDSRLFDQFISQKSRIIELHDEEFYYNKIRDAGWNTLRKAMNFKEPLLVDEAVGNMEKAGLPDLRSFSLKSNIYYGIRTRDEQRFTSNLEQFFSEEGAGDVDACIEFTDLALRVFGETEKVLDVLDSGLKRVSGQTDHSELYYRHAKVLNFLGRSRQARRAIDTAIELAGEEEIEKYQLLKEQI
nr:thioredoxin family protein [Saprospiraceae bacterium]